MEGSLYITQLSLIVNRETPDFQLRFSLLSAKLRLHPDSSKQ